MNKLSEKDKEVFYKLISAVLFYANKRFNVIKNISTKEDFFKTDIKKTIPLRKKIYENPGIFDDFANENPENFNSEELNIICSWKKFKQGRFVLAKYTKEHAIFFDEKEGRAYGVLGITDSFEDVFEGYAPILMDIVLLPFKGKITYEGIFVSYNIYFGGGIKRSLKINLGEAIQRYGIITCLDEPAEERKNNDEKMLRFYMGSREKINKYLDKINELRVKSPKLEAVYHQERAKNSARAIKKSLKRNEIKGYFAVLDESVVASGGSSKELNKNIKTVVPQNKIDWIYKFRL